MSTTEFDPTCVTGADRIREAIARLRRSRDRMLAQELPSLRRGIERIEEVIDGLTERLAHVETAAYAATPIEAWAVLVDAEGREVSNRAFCVIEPDDGTGNRRVDRALELEGEPEAMASAVRLRLLGCDGGQGEMVLDHVGASPLWFDRPA